MKVSNSEDGDVVEIQTEENGPSFKLACPRVGNFMTFYDEDMSSRGRVFDKDLPKKNVKIRNPTCFLPLPPPPETVR